jgi:RHS repeat-associated protein
MGFCAGSDDAFGKVSSRSYNTTTATLSYDGLDQLVKWDNGTGGQEQYVYDASGSRVLQRSTVAGTTTMTVSAFGTEEHQYNGAGVNQANTYSYSLDGHLIGESTGTTTNIFLTDGLGSVITAISATAGSASVQGNQAYGPYGNTRYQAGSMGTAKGFTGQYQDATGLDYYNARYYDPVVGRFLSADIVEGNAVGMDPYAYVGDNPETHNDPTGQSYCEQICDVGLEGGGGGGDGEPPCFEECLPPDLGQGLVFTSLHLLTSVLKVVGIVLLIAIIWASVTGRGQAQNPDRGWDLTSQRKLAYQLALKAEAARDQYIQQQKAAGIPKDKINQYNYGIGYLQVVGPDGTRIFPKPGGTGYSPVFPGEGEEPYNYNHSEKQIIRWAVKLISQMSQAGELTPGPTINLLIYSRYWVCPTCKAQIESEINGWLQTLENAAGGPYSGVIINLYVWQAQDYFYPHLPHMVRPVYPPTASP